MSKVILHIDFDSFFASVAQQDNPILRGRPIGVTATNGRTVIIAASREAKALGVRSPSRTFDAQKICPSIIFVAGDFNRYWKISKAFINIVREYSPYVEVFSLDEVFIDVTATHHLFGGVYPLIENIKKRLKNEIGEYVTASVGISHNKMLSKLGSGMRKPNGVFEINKDNLADVYKEVKLSDICGIGRRIEARLNQMGIYSLVQLSKCPLNYLIAEFGESEGHFLFNVGRGVDPSDVIPYSQFLGVKSVGRNYCLSQNEFDMRKATQNVYELCEEVALKLRRLDKKARGVGFYFRGDKDISGRKTFDNYIDSGKELFESIQLILNQESGIKNYSYSFLIPNSLFINLNYLRQVNIWTFSLKDADSVPLSIFETEQKNQKITKVIDNINEKYGDHTIRNGFLLYADKLTTLPNGFMADKYERQKLAEEEQAKSLLT